MLRHIGLLVMDYLSFATVHYHFHYLSFFSDKIVDKNFLREIAHHGKSLISIFKGFFASIGKMFFFFWGGGGLGAGL